MVSGAVPAGDCGWQSNRLWVFATNRLSIRMQSLARRSLVRLSAGVALALLAGWALAPSAARGECGDYVRVGGASHLARGAAADPSGHPAAPTAGEAPHRAPSPAGGRLPCSGPRCSRGPLHAPLVPVSAPPVSAERDCCLPPPTLPGDGGPVLGLVADNSSLPIPQASRIFHPPR